MKSYYLSDKEMDFLQTMMPKHYSFQSIKSQGKRVRAVKKMDDSFTDDFNLIEPKTIERTYQNHNDPDKYSIVEVQKKHKNKIDVSVNQKQINRQIQVQAYQKIQRQNMMKSFLCKLKAHKSSKHFRMPVDPVVQGVPEYFDMIKQPMDLKTMERKVRSHQYQNIQQFYEDVRLIISNSFAFNGQDTIYYQLTKQFQNYFSTLVAETKNKQREVSGLRQVDIEINLGQVKRSQRIKPSHNKKYNQISREKPQNGDKIVEKSKPVKAKLSAKQHQRIFQQIQSLDQEAIKKLCRLVKGNQILGEDWQQFEFDLTDLSQEKLTRLSVFLAEQTK